MGIWGYIKKLIRNFASVEALVMGVEVKLYLQFCFPRIFNYFRVYLKLPIRKFDQMLLVLDHFWLLCSQVLSTVAF